MQGKSFDDSPPLESRITRKKRDTKEKIRERERGNEETVRDRERKVK